MIAVFGAFVPTGDAIIKAIALGLAVGVFTDAFLVRMTLVPAVLALLGDRAWSAALAGPPAPKVDVEGEGPFTRSPLRDWPTPESDHQVYGEGLAIEHADGTAVYGDIDVAVSRGDVLAVTGHGSSALLLTLSGRVVPDHGDLKIGGMVVPEENRKIRRVVPFLTSTRRTRTHGRRRHDAVDREEPAGPARHRPRGPRARHGHRGCGRRARGRRGPERIRQVILGLVDQRVDWMMPADTRYTLLDLEADRLAPLASGGAHS